MRRRLRGVPVLLVAAGMVLCTASTASAANVVPNPSFEDVCGGPTTACYWPELNSPPFLFQRSTSYAKTGSASYLMSYAGDAFTTGTGTACVASSITDGSATVGFSYRTAASAVGHVELFVHLYSEPDCQGFLQTLSAITFEPMTDDAWNDLSSSATIPAAQSYNMQIGFGCNGSCAGEPAEEVYFDDVVLNVQQTPTAVLLNSIQVERRQLGVVLQWRTASDGDLLGFNLYRQQRGKLVKVNGALIPSVFGGTTSGHTYSLLDRSAPNGAVRYRLQAVSLSGKRSWVGSAAVAR
jgi:hypothetical protein